MIDLPEAVEQLASRVDALEQRVAHLEGSAHAPADSSRAVATPRIDNQAQIGSPERFAILGKSLLGIAGAYLLRALAATSVSRPLIVTAGVAYALAWLLLAARTTVRLASSLYAATSVLILVPMLWEMCVRIQALSPDAAGLVLLLYLAAASWIGFRKPHSPSFSAACCGTAIAALLLSITTHAVATFSLVLAAALLICEAAQHRECYLRFRWIVALAADAGVWILLFIYRAPAAARPEYPNHGPIPLITVASLPFLLSFPGVAIRTVRSRHDLTAFDVIQATISFSLIALAFLWLLPASGSLILGILCLILAACCYAATFGLLRRRASLRTFTIGSLWSAALLLSGIMLVLREPAGSVFASIVGFSGIFFGGRIQSRTSEFHGVIFLVLAGVLSGLLAYIEHAFWGSKIVPPDWPLLLASALAVLSCAISDETPADPWQIQSLHFVPTLLASAAGAALLTFLSASALSAITPAEPFHLSLIRTVMLCATAIGLAFLASRRHRLSLRRVAYCLLAMGAAKLPFQDLRHGRMEFTAASICVVALTVIAVPRLSQFKSQNPELQS